MQQITVFYSWQSDLSESTNKRAIRSALLNASNNLEDEIDYLKIDVDEATRNEAGSPSIPESIFNKIGASDIFICDVTTINQQSENVRKVPNPNVLIELGYAISQLGWERILLVFNTKLGTFPDDLPFDIGTHRVATYKLDDPKNKGALKPLEARLTEDLRTIITRNPPKRSAKGESSDARKRQFDIAQLEKVLLCFNIETFDDFLENAPARIPHRMFAYWYQFDETVRKSSFHLYDEELEKLILKMHSEFEEALSNGNVYGPIPGIAYYKFESSGNQHSQKIYARLLENIESLKKSFKAFIKYIRMNYIDIDIEDLSRKAFEQYKKIKKEAEKPFTKKKRK